MRKLKLPLAACIWLGLLTPALRADEAFDKLMHDFMAAQQAWGEKIGKAQEASSQPIDFDKLPPNPVGEFAPRFKAYAEQKKGKPEAIPALTWLVSAQLSSEPGKPGEMQRWALGRLESDHAADAALGDSLHELQYAGWSVGLAPLQHFYEQVLARNKDAEARARATLNLALLLNERFELPGSERDAAQRLADQNRAAELFRQIVRDYPKSRSAKPAENYIFELEHLQTGMAAPDLEGRDADGKKITLSQFKGQVVVLDFWGFW